MKDVPAHEVYSMVGQILLLHIKSLELHDRDIFASQ